MLYLDRIDVRFGIFLAIFNFVFVAFNLLQEYL